MLDDLVRQLVELGLVVDHRQVLDVVRGNGKVVRALGNGDFADELVVDPARVLRHQELRGAEAVVQNADRI